ncbi:MaoC family dehydratase [Rhodococcoides fascians]|uniref:MaoC family dehydratase n=1 Tax=Rhodococcoides fascians TaxID=1828 RepID=UPI00055B487E|nr:MaoC family dehydratase [Rhodococcus fascians]
MSTPTANTDTPELTFDAFEVPVRVGEAKYVASEANAKKLAYSVDDESGWVVGAEDDRRVHPALMSEYLWWPQGFYVQEPEGAGHFDQFWNKFPSLVEYPFLHSRTVGKFYQAPKVEETIHAVADVVEKYERRNKDFVVIRALYTNDSGERLAEYSHTIMIRSRVDLSSPPVGGGGSQTDSKQTSPAVESVGARPEAKTSEVTSYTAQLTLAHARLFSLPTESFHTHDSIAQEYGFPKAVPQGLMSFAYLSRLCTEYFGSDWANSGEIDVKFIGMLYRDDTLTVSGTAVSEDTATDDPSLITLKLHIDDQNGRRVAVGTARGHRRNPETD